MKHFFRLTAIALLLTLFVLPASAQIFYKVEKDGNDKTSYILGSHHLAPLSILDSIPGINDAMQNCEVVVGEIDMTIPQMQLAMAMQPYMMAPQDSTMSALLSKEDFDALNEKFKKYSPLPGVGLEAFDVMRPMALSTMISMAMIQESMPGFNPEEQLDSYFQQKFNEEGKKIIPLETPEMQAKLLYTFIPISGQIEVLKEMLDEPEKLEEATRKINEAYSKHDLAKLYELSMEDDSEQEFNEALIRNRNLDWSTKLPAIFDNSAALVVVGALHLPGNDGLLNLLESAGYKITPIN